MGERAPDGEPGSGGERKRFGEPGYGGLALPAIVGRGEPGGMPHDAGVWLVAAAAETGCGALIGPARRKAGGPESLPLDDEPPSSVNFTRAPPSDVVVA